MKNEIIVKIKADFNIEAKAIQDKWNFNLQDENKIEVAELSDIPELTDAEIKDYKTIDFRAKNNRESFEAGMIHYRNWLKDTLING